LNIRAVFIGNVNFSAAILKKLIGIDVKIDLVITKKESSFNADFYDLSTIAKKHKLPYKYVENINQPKVVDWLKKLNPDIIFCLGFSQIINQEIINIPSIGVIGYHPAELPKNRGRHPIIWSLVLGLDKTASTFFFMDEGADTGDILSQRPIEISQNDNAGTLYQKITEVALNQIEEVAFALESGTYKRIKQNNENANFWRKRGLKDGKIDWRMSAKSIHNLVRGLSKPYIGAHFKLEDKKIKVWETKLVVNDVKNIEPGKVILVDKKGIVVKTGENAIRLLITEPKIEIKQGSYL
jgi:methionyl-tRNA formyltransferase